MEVEVRPLPPTPPKLPPRNVTKSIVLDRVTVREIKRLARQRDRSFSDVIYEFCRAGLEATAAADATEESDRRASA